MNTPVKRSTSLEELTLEAAFYEVKELLSHLAGLFNKSGTVKDNDGQALISVTILCQCVSQHPPQKISVLRKAILRRLELWNRAIRLLDGDHRSCGALGLDQVTEGRRVHDVLLDKHSDVAFSDISMIPDTMLPSDLQFHPTFFEAIDADCIVTAAKQTFGSAGPSGMDASSWRAAFTHFGR
ncbi:hypothetical protein GJ496_011842 [Pomphorhynchus laevis]|nr:hypothetical protein GJ496_011842 [Pomphorhynchus laevis]